MKRTKLRAAFEYAWKATIEDDYCKRLVNSESALQAFFIAHLRSRLEGAETRQIFVQPQLRVGSKRCYPDLVVCDLGRIKQIVGVVELKYLPKVRLAETTRQERHGVVKDLQTLSGLMAAKEPPRIAAYRYRGPEEGNAIEASLASDALFCWAGVYEGKKAGLSLPSKNFLQLDACTSRERSAWALSNGRRINRPQNTCAERLNRFGGSM